MKHELKNLIVRNYKVGDEVELVEFLNLCYGKWGDLKKWRYLYPSYPTFSNDNIVIMEHDGKIVGHGGMHTRGLVTPQNRKLSAVMLGDGAVHPRYRRMGIHSRLLRSRFQLAKLKGICLNFGWVLKGSDAYKSDIKSGFVEIRQSTAYMKVIRPEKFFKIGLLDTLRKSQRLRKSLQNLDFDLEFYFGEFKLSITDLLGETCGGRRRSRRYLKVILDRKALSSIASFRNMDRLRRVVTLFFLLAFRRIKIKYSSFRTLLSAVIKGVDIIGAL